MDDQVAFPENLLDFLQSISSDPVISHVFAERPHLKRQIEPFHPIKSAALVAGLLTEPSLQANALRIELLVHLLIAFSSGKKKNRVRSISRWLNKELGMSIFSRFEDPIEDVFISNVTTDEGNIRIFEGLWESNDFYLQRILNVVKTLPNDQDALQLKREVQALLKLSEEIARRRGLTRFSSGGGIPKGRIKIPSLEKLKQLRKALTFSPEEFDALGISSSDLSPFIFQASLRNQLRKQSIGDSLLEKCPIVNDGQKWIVLLPTAMSIAIRRHVFEWCESRGYQNSFNKHIAAEYWRFLRETPILGSLEHRYGNISPEKVSNDIFFEFVMKIDEGRYLQVIAIVDCLEGYLCHHFSASTEDAKILSDEIESRIEKTKFHLCQQEGFRQGLTLLIGCGYGRPSLFSHSEETENWWIEVISAPELYTLGWASEKTPFLLWKLAKQKRFLKENGISISNINGLLNLYSWWLSTDYLLHPSDPEWDGKPMRLVIPTNCLLETRKKVRQGCDPHVLPLPNGQFSRVQKGPEGYFTKRNERSLYRSVDLALKGELSGAWVGKGVCWISVDQENSKLSRDTISRLWEAIYHWMENAGPVFEDCMQSITFQSLMIILDFNDMHQEQVDPVPSYSLPDLLSHSVDQEKMTIHIHFHDPFLGGFRNPKNDAEKAIMRAILIGVLKLTGENPAREEGLDSILAKIVPNEDARYFHIFEAKHFRDYILSYDSPKCITVDEADDAISKLELGYLIRRLGNDTRVTKKEESVSFLNKTVDEVLKKIIKQLNTLDRSDLIEHAFRNIEGADTKKRGWYDTFRATLALHGEKVVTKDIAIEEIGCFNAAKLASRLIIEIAISECPLDGGLSVGKLDFASLMSDILHVFRLGGLSDAIRKGVMNPEIKIMNNGIVQFSTDFNDNIYEPLGKLGESSQFDRSEESYEKKFEPIKPVETVNANFPEAFSLAFEAEFGLSVDAVRYIRDAFEELAVEKTKCVFIARRDEILSYFDGHKLASSEMGKIVLERFALWTGKRWDRILEGFAEKDRHLWRFGRQLSLLARPLVKLENGENPRYIVSPSLFGVGFSYALSSYYKGTIAPEDCKSKRMKSWVGAEANRCGHEFANEVFDALRSLGYEARLEIEVSELLNEKQDRNWGDIDVFAWKPGGSHFLAIECKNLKEARTPNEIAAQLNNFSGKMKSNGRPDALLKHLDRCNHLKLSSCRVAKTLGLDKHDTDIETVVCFSKPVPMLYVSQQFPDVIFLTLKDFFKKSTEGVV